ncbi:GIY-YIG nuclease family protein [Providencia manganoxydans]|uniref:GIY-YIG nuclease family protein n=1 Tax=Providencia manganoxydans TaxID=2923283 RepID=UPI0034E5DF41
MTQIEKWLQEIPTTEVMGFPEEYSPKGWVYVLSNEAMPNIFKVGLTTTHPKKRARELSSSTGVPEKFEIVKAFISENPAKDEAAIHKELARYRVNEGREFFKCPLKKILSVCERIIPDGSAVKVNDLTDKYNLISFESFDRFSDGEIMEICGITYFGGERECLTRLALFGAEFVRHLTKDGGAVVFNNSAFTVLLPEGTDEI